MILIVWSGGTSSTQDLGSTPEISFETYEILNGENQLFKMEFSAWLFNIAFKSPNRSQECCINCQLV